MLNSLANLTVWKVEKHWTLLWLSVFNYLTLKKMVGTIKHLIIIEAEKYFGCFHETFVESTKNQNCHA